MKTTRVAAFLVCSFLFLTAAAKDPGAPSYIAVYPSEREADLRQQGATIWGRDGDLVIASIEDAKLIGIEPIAVVLDDGQWIYLFHHDPGRELPEAKTASVQALTATTDLVLFPGSARVDLPAVDRRAGFRAVPRLELGPRAVHPADLSASFLPEVANPLVTSIVNATSQASWFQDVKDLSGENTVVVGGVTRTIATRYSDAMFPTPAANAYASEYLLEKGAGWGYQGVREPYTSAQSGCSQGTWQNLVFTLPGQVDFGQHQQVIFVTHYDSLSFSTSESLSYAPGADDAISGGSALIEALRLFKDYGFKNTVKIVFFSGEEEGLCGSEAYVRMHPLADMWRVVNMDQTAYDGNLNRLMDCYNWSLASSPQSVALGDAFVQANSDYGTIIPPGNIVRDTTHMCQTDHCPFWDVGVAAIALTEDLHNNDICPCFDQTQTATCHDTVTQIDPNHAGRLMFDQAYSWPTEKAAIALVAHLAEPLYACPAAAPDPVVTQGNHALSLSWPAAANVTNYVLERAASCAGPFTAVASVGATSFDDTGLTNGTSYAYRLRTCPTQVSACVTGTPNGPSVVYQGGSAQVVADSGDHDLIPDNCELVTVQLNLQNDGNQDLTDVRLATVGSTYPGAQVATAVPLRVGALAIGQTKSAGFKFYLGRNGNAAACGQSLPFVVTAASGESAPIERSFALTAERDVASGTLTYGFDTDLSGWTVTTGTFGRAAGGAPGSTAFSLHSRNLNSICDAIVSPVIVPSAASTLSLWINYSIESGRWDRALVRVIDPATGTKTHLTPVSGAPYTTTGTNTALCDGIGQLAGWSGNLTTWTQSNFNLAAFAGVPVQVEVRFSTDTSALGTQGFWFDQVQITNASQPVCDAQANACAALPAEVSPAGSPTPFTLSKSSGSDLGLRFAEVAGAGTYNVYVGSLASLQAGLYDHAEAAGLCGFTDAVTGDDVSATVPSVAVPDDSYLLAVARNGAGESPYGSSTAAAIPMAFDVCP